MTPSRFLAAVRTVALTLCVLGAVALVLYALPAHAQDGPAITPNTACGAPGVGRLLGRADPVARSASDATGTYVAADGYWTTCPQTAPLDTACANGSRIKDGRRVLCDQPCGGDGSARTWSVSGNVCTSYLRYSSQSASDPSRDHGIRHGEAGMWSQWTGPMRGHLIERCDDGKRTTIGATCAPAAACDTRVEYQGHVYDGSASPAPLGATVQMRRADGSTWPATCVAGSWDVPSVRPVVTSPTARPPKPARCGYSVLTLADEGRTYRVRYMGPAVAPGVVVPGLELGGERVAQLVCGNDGRLRQVPPEQPADPTARWRELMQR